MLMAMRLREVRVGPDATIDADRDHSIERMTLYGSEGWGFESLQAHPSNVLHCR